MTDPTDPIDNWLSADVELMQPLAGTYRRVAGRARRRRTIRAMTVAAGAVVVIAAVVTVPQLAATLLPGSGGPASVADGSSSPTPGTRTTAPGPGPHPASPTPRSSAGRTGSAPSGSGPPLSVTGSGQPAAPGLRPSSVTFVSPSVGAVLGQAGSSCATRACVAMAGTSTYGQSWYKVGAPPAGPPNGSVGVSQVRFLNLQDGWAYGPQLFATHDGGQTWTQITGLRPGRVIDLATVGDRAFAVLATCGGTGPDYASSCTSFTLLSATADSDSWAAVPGTAAGIPVSPGGLQITGQRGYLLAHGALYAGPVTDGEWHPVPAAAPGRPPCLGGARQPGWQPGAGLLAQQPGDVYLVCTSASGSKVPASLGSLILYASPDGGHTWQDRGVIADQGTAESLAVAPGGAIVLATSAGIYYSPDAASWHQSSLSGQAPRGGFSYVGMTTTLQGVAVPASGLHEIFTTGDGGRTWHSRAIP